MTTSEPTLSLRQALELMGAAGRMLGRLPGKAAETWFVGVEHDGAPLVIGVGETPEDALEDWLKRPVVARDDTAELVEALREARHFVVKAEEKLGDLSAPSARDRIDAALARHRGEP